MRKMDRTIVQDQEVFVGIDVSKKSYAVAVRSGGALVYRCQVPAQYTHLRALWERLPDCEIHAVYEAGFSGFGLYDALVGDGIEARVTPPSKVARTGDRVKTDRRDARTLAHQLASGMLRRCRVPTPEARVARAWSRYLNQLIGQQTRLKAQIKSCLDWHGITAELDTQRRWSRAYRAQVQQLVGASGPLSVIVPDMLARLAETERRVTEIKLRLRVLARQAPYREPVELFQSAPGIGWLTAIRLVLEWQDLRDFPNGAAFASYLGLTPSEYSSGDQVRRGGITRQGNGRVRAWLIEAAWRAITQDPALGARFRRLAPGRAKGMRKRAIVAVARTLALRLRACWMSGQPYVMGVVR
jgi:transposase